MNSSDGTSARLFLLVLSYLLLEAVAAFAFRSLGALDSTYAIFGSCLVALGVILSLGWYQVKSTRTFRLGGARVPTDVVPIALSGVALAVLLPAAWLLGRRIVLLQAGVIVISCLVDRLQQRKGYLRVAVYLEENTAAALGIAAAGTMMVIGDGLSPEPLRWTPLLVCLAAYTVRIYILNEFRNTRPRGALLDHRGYFAVERLVASTLLLLGGLVLCLAPSLRNQVIGLVPGAHSMPAGSWLTVLAAGTTLGLAGILSVFLMLYPGRTATFSGAADRTVVLLAILLARQSVRPADGISLALTIGAMAFLVRAEQRRSRELVDAEVLEGIPSSGRHLETISGLRLGGRGMPEASAPAAAPPPPPA